MQNRYVGDVGDFAKYALLRRLVNGTGQHVRLGVVWCLYPNESHNDDGRHVSYLCNSDYAALDPDLHGALRHIVNSGNRSISAIANGTILPRGTVFCDAHTCPAEPAKREDRLLHRSNWLADSLRLTKACQLVFLDPDNGVEVASVPKHHPKAGKYIFWDELVPFWKRGQSLVIYHHLNRTKPGFYQVAQLTAHFKVKFEGALIRPLVFRRGSCRVFWLACPNSPLGREIERRAIEFLRGDWTRHFREFE